MQPTSSASILPRAASTAGGWSQAPGTGMPPGGAIPATMAAVELSHFAYNVSTLPRYTALCSEAALLVSRMPARTSGVVNLSIAGSIAMVCPEAMWQRNMTKPVWHALEHRDARRRTISTIIERLVAAANAAGLPPPDHSRLESQAATLERGCYYGASDFVAYQDLTTLDARIATLETFRPRLIAAQATAVAPPASSAGGAALPTAAELFAAMQAPSGPKPEKTEVPGAASGSVPGVLTVPSAPGGLAIMTGALPADKSQLAAARAQSVAAQQTQRLHLLIHSNYCQQPAGTCTFAHCDEFRKLWTHLRHCKDFNSCKVPHCSSSQMCLAHYRTCGQATCEICAPVKQHAAKMKEQAAEAAAANASVAGIKRSHAAMTGAADASAGAEPKRPKTDDAAEAAASRQRELSYLIRQRYPNMSTEAWRGLAQEEREKLMTEANRERESIIAKGQLPNLQAAISQKAAAAAASASAIPPSMPPVGLSEVPLLHAPGGSAAAATGAAAPRRPRGRLDGDCTLLATFTRVQIMKHLTSLRDDFNAGIGPDAIREQVVRLLDTLMSMELSPIFNTPVDVVRLKLPDYYDIVKKPMDLGRIKKQLDAGHYRTFKSFAEDVRLVWHNAMIYNPKNTYVHVAAERMSDFFKNNWQRWERNWQSYFAKMTQDPEHCSVCGGATFPFEPATLYCNVCSGRIRKNQPYYGNRGNRFHWCPRCYQDLPKGKDIVIDSVTIPYSELVKKKNDGEFEEPWVQCDHCSRWQHQVCTLYNGKRNTDSDIPHYCPHCILGHMTARKQEAAIAKPVRGAASLPRTRLSEFIEKRVRMMLESKRDLLAAEQDVSRADAEMPDFSIRMVCNVEKTVLVQPEMHSRYKAQGYPSQFNYRSKVLLLFQNLAGVDVLLYAVYVQEYSDDCAEPNRRCAYLSYLDSVKYLDPASLRTDVYHEILVAYLEDLKARGFNQLSLWSCPPQKGDDYIIHCHPEDQKTPKREMLLEWYITMAEEAQRRGIVEKVCFLADDYFPSLSGHEGGADRTLTQLPYFEGDYWPGQAEVESKRLRDKPNSAESQAAAAAAKKDMIAQKVAKGLMPATAGAADGDSGPEDETDPSSATAGGGAGGPKAGAARGRSKSKRNAGGRRTGGAATTTPAAAPAPTVRSKARGVVLATDGNVLPDDDLRNVIAGLLTTMRQDFLVAKLRPSCQFCKRFITGAAGLDVRHHCRACERTPAPPLIAAHPKRPGSFNAQDPSRRPGITFDLCSACYEREKVMQEAGGKGLLNHAHPLTEFSPIGVELAPGLKRQIDAAAAAAAPQHSESGGSSSARAATASSSLHTPSVSAAAAATAEAAAAAAPGEPVNVRQTDPAHDAVTAAMLSGDTAMTGHADASVMASQHPTVSGEGSSSAPASGHGATGTSDSGKAMVDTEPEGSGQGTSSDGGGGTNAGGTVEDALALPTLSGGDAGSGGDKGTTSDQPASTGTSSMTSGGGSSAIVSSDGSKQVGAPLMAVSAADRGDGVLIDEDPLLESPFWKTRQAFLNLCQGNHYQFDQIRRAKHSSMMVLYHMHHPFAPSFVHNCNHCGKLIDRGLRYSCSTCEEFDLCETCYKTVGRNHEHPLLSYETSGLGNEERQAEMQKEEARRRATVLHQLELLAHAPTCAGCAVRDCSKMKGLLQHTSTCKEARGSCNICRHMTSLLMQHARTCRLQGRLCAVPGCEQMKERMRAAASNAVDARRRAKATSLALGKPMLADQEEQAAAANNAAEGGAGGASAVATADASASAMPRVDMEGAPAMSMPASSSEGAGGVAAQIASKGPREDEGALPASGGSERDDRARKLLALQPQLEREVRTFRENPVYAPIFKTVFEECLSELRRKFGLASDTTVESLEQLRAAWLQYRAVVEMRKAIERMQRKKEEEERARAAELELARPTANDAGQAADGSSSGAILEGLGS